MLRGQRPLPCGHRRLATSARPPPLSSRPVIPIGRLFASELRYPRESLRNAPSRKGGPHGTPRRYRPRLQFGSTSLVVYETKREDAAKPFRTLVDEKKMAGLAAYVTDESLSSAGIARAVTVLGDLLKLADNLNCARVDIFATAVLRNCANSEAATAAIETAINHRVRVLSAREEAHLGFVGASIGTPLAAGTLIDVGGGSWS